MSVLRLDNMKHKIIKFKFSLWDLWRTYILSEKDCDNCDYFGGLMCDHVDENFKCLGWERKKYKRSINNGRSSNSRY